jgi:hypothetical protein
MFMYGSTVGCCYAHGFCFMVWFIGVHCTAMQAKPLRKYFPPRCMKIMNVFAREVKKILAFST